NIQLFITYAKNTLIRMSSIDKDYFQVILRIMRLYREIDDNQSAYSLSEEKELHAYIQTSLHFSDWDITTQSVALGYLLSKYSITSLHQSDHLIFKRITSSIHLICTQSNLFTHTEILSFYLWYMRMYGRTMSTVDLEEHLINISYYINNHFIDLFHNKIAIEYAQWVHMFSKLPIKKSIIHIHRALS